MNHKLDPKKTERRMWVSLSAGHSKREELTENLTDPMLRSNSRYRRSRIDTNNNSPIPEQETNDKINRRSIHLPGRVAMVERKVPSTKVDTIVLVTGVWSGGQVIDQNGFNSSGSFDKKEKDREKERKALTKQSHDKETNNKHKRLNIEKCLLSQQKSKKKQKTIDKDDDEGDEDEDDEEDDEDDKDDGKTSAWQQRTWSSIFSGDSVNLRKELELLDQPLLCHIFGVVDIKDLEITNDDWLKWK